MKLFFKNISFFVYSGSSEEPPHVRGARRGRSVEGENRRTDGPHQPAGSGEFDTESERVARDHRAVAEARVFDGQQRSQRAILAVAATDRTHQWPASLTVRPLGRPSKAYMPGN